ncbi:AaceriAFL134Wp [[Ashbya] aceris (nom. inval.)]|nr:AaceriAFL134Wp [[Ashbya] aceris (nom. inval.)]
MSSEKQEGSPRRVLSLSDLVNREDCKDASGNTTGGALKPLSNDEVRRRLAHEDYSSNTASQVDDETDTDDGLGEVAFDRADFRFDFEGQERSGGRASGEAEAESGGPGHEKARQQPSDATATSPDRESTEPRAMDIFEERASLESKKNNLRKDLRVLNEIASTARPGRYKVAPIWAQKWKPTVRALQNVNSKDLMKIDVSFTQVIPDDDLTKSVQDWIYATLLSIPPEQRQYVEVEMKFGILMDRSSDSQRVTPPVSSQTVYMESDARMKPDVDERVFVELNRYVKGISELTENTGKFNIIESHNRDELYRAGMNTQRPRFLRMSKDVKTGRVGEFIEKRRISQLLLFSPKDSYDVKISINVELPVPENDPPEKYMGQAPLNSRTKERISYIHNDSCTRIDITKVTNHNKGKRDDAEVTHEIELELNSQALLAAFDKIAQDSKDYATIIRTFLNNGTIIRRKLTSLSYEIFEGGKKVL